MFTVLTYDFPSISYKTALDWLATRIASPSHVLCFLVWWFLLGGFIRGTSSLILGDAWHTTAPSSTLQRRFLKMSLDREQFSSGCHRHDGLIFSS